MHSRMTRTGGTVLFTRHPHRRRSADEKLLPLMKNIEPLFPLVPAWTDLGFLMTVERICFILAPFVDPHLCSLCRSHWRQQNGRKRRNVCTSLATFIPGTNLLVKNPNFLMNRPIEEVTRPVWFLNAIQRNSGSSPNFSMKCRLSLSSWVSRLGSLKIQTESSAVAMPVHNAKRHRISGPEPRPVSANTVSCGDWPNGIAGGPNWVVAAWKTARSRRWDWGAWRALEDAKRFVSAWGDIRIGIEDIVCGGIGGSVYRRIPAQREHRVYSSERPRRIRITGAKIICSKSV